MHQTLPSALARQRKRKEQSSSVSRSASKRRSPATSATTLLDRDRDREYGSTRIQSESTLVNETLTDSDPDDTRTPTPSQEPESGFIDDPEQPRSDSLTTETPPPLLTLLTNRRVAITLANIGTLTFSDMACQVLIPLVYSTSVELGGLGMVPYEIGVLLGMRGIINAVIQVSQSCSTLEGEADLSNRSIS